MKVCTVSPDAALPLGIPSGARSQRPMPPQRFLPPSLPLSLSLSLPLPRLSGPAHRHHHHRSAAPQSSAWTPEENGGARRRRAGPRCPPAPRPAPGYVSAAACTGDGQCLEGCGPQTAGARVAASKPERGLAGYDGV
eukprot:scaffold1328_cov394-Prasinococcus_capsulatus_cf.AAC.6